MSEAHGMVTYLVDVECSRRGWRLFRNSQGRAWLGQVTEESMIQGKRGPEKVIELFGAHMIPYGLGVGTSDRVGWRPLSLPDGRVIAQFVAIEAKTPAYDKCTEEQRNFLQAVVRAGGAAFIARRRGTELELEEIKAEEAPCTAR